MELSENFSTTLQKTQTKKNNLIICVDCNNYLCRKRLEVIKLPFFNTCKSFNNSIADPDDFLTARRKKYPC